MTFKRIRKERSKIRRQDKPRRNEDKRGENYKRYTREKIEK